MTKEQFLANLTNEEAYSLVNKAMMHAGAMPESDWSVKEGAWQSATKNGVVDGNRPLAFITRQEVVAVLGRIFGELKKK